MLCRVLKVSPSGFNDWAKRAPSPRAVADRELLATIEDIHAMARGTYGARRVHAELTLGRNVSVGRCSIERLMRQAGLQGVHRRRFRHGGHRQPAVFDDHVQRVFVADAPDRLWVTDIT